MKISELLRENDADMDRLFSVLLGKNWEIDVELLSDKVSEASSGFQKRVKSSTSSLLSKLYLIKQDLKDSNMEKSNYMKKIDSLIYFLEETQHMLGEKRKRI
jgi:hypothetical protein